MSGKYFDLTKTISERTEVYPGDSRFRREKKSCLEHAGNFVLYEIHLSNHLGTHIDYPKHVIAGGKGSNDYPLENLISQSLIILVKDREVVPSDLMAHTLSPDQFILFRTAREIDSPGGYLSMEVAEILVKNKIRLVGIDFMSVDAPASVGLEIHNFLLKNGVLIVENLDFSTLPKTVFFGRTYIMPMKIDDIDGASSPCFI